MTTEMETARKEKNDVKHALTQIQMMSCLMKKNDQRLNAITTIHKCNLEIYVNIHSGFNFDR